MQQNKYGRTAFTPLLRVLAAVLIAFVGIGMIVSLNARAAAPQALSALSINDVTVNENGAFINFTVSLNPITTTVVWVNYTTNNDTATAGQDYVAATGSISFPVGVSSRTISVPILEDILDENNETFNIVLSGEVNATIADAVGVGTITDNDALPVMSINDSVVTEGNAPGTVNSVYTLTLNTPSGRDLSVRYATSNGTATASSGDYNSIAATTITFTAGMTRTVIPVTVNGDASDEFDETFNLNLSNENNVSVPDDQGVTTILDDDDPPTLSVVDLVRNENASGTYFNIAVDVSILSGKPITFTFSTVDGTALVADNDYTAVTNKVVRINAGNDGVAQVAVTKDTKYEPNENFTVVISQTINATILDNTGLITITNDDTLPAISIANRSLPELDSGTQPFTFTVSLNHPSYMTVTVQYTTTNNTAIAGIDYQYATGLVVFPPGTSTQDVYITVNGDINYEGNELFYVDLGAPTGATISDGRGNGTIQNDDPIPALFVNDVSLGEGNSGDQTYIFTVSMDRYSIQTVGVSWATADNTAVAGSDYDANSGTLSFPAGTLTQTVSVIVHGDTLYELDEIFNIVLSSPTNGTLAEDSTGDGVIINDEPLPVVAITDVTLPEPDSGEFNMVFTVTLDSQSELTTTIPYSTTDVSTTAGEDYLYNAGSLILPPFSTSITMTVVAYGDIKFETDEVFHFSLGAPENAALGEGYGIGTIQNNDIQPTLAVADVSQNEGDSGETAFDFILTLSNPSYQTITADFNTSNGVALAGEDYQSKTAAVVFPNGALTQTVTVIVNGDIKYEPVEDFNVTLTNPQNTTFSDAAAVGTIQNDDAVPLMSITDVSMYEGNSGLGSMVFTVTLDRPSYQQITVNFATVSDTAQAGSDYQIASGMLTFPPNNTQQNIVVGIIGDVIDEADETFKIALTTLNNAQFADPTAVGTILNDEGLVMISIADVHVGDNPTADVPIVFTLSLSKPSQNTITVLYQTADGTALAGQDYTAATNMVTFPPNVVTRTLQIVQLSDRINEGVEEFYVNLSNPTNAIIEDGHAVAKIEDYFLHVPVIMKKYYFPGVYFQPGSGLVTDETGRTATFNVTLFSPPSAPVTVNVLSQDTTEGVSSASTYVIQPADWATPKVVTIAGVDDYMVDGNQAYKVKAWLTSADPTYNYQNAYISVTNLENDLFLDMFTSDLGWSKLFLPNSEAWVTAGEYHLKQTAVSSEARALAPLTTAQTPAALSVQADIYLSPGGNNQSGYGIIFNYTGTNSFYVFEILPTSQVWILRKMTTSGYSNISNGNSTAINTGSMNTLRVIHVGSTISLYINGTLVYSGSDSTYTGGQSGLALFSPSVMGGGYAEAVYDNFLVSTMTP